MHKSISEQTKRSSWVIFVLTSLVLASCFSSTTGSQTPLSSPDAPPASTATSGSPEEPIVIFKSIEQLSDVSQTDEVYQPLRNLIERYGIAVAYGDTTFQGNRGLTRYELAMTLASASDQSARIANLAFAPYATKEQTQDIVELQQKVIENLLNLRGQLDLLEAKRNFSPTFHQPIRDCLKQSDLAQLISLTTSEASSKGQVFEENKPVQLAQVTSISQIPDVRPTDWAFNALQSLLERYGIGHTLLYPDGTFRGNQVLQRSHFVTALSAALENIIELQQAASSDIATKSEVTLLSASFEDMATELKHLQKRLERLPQGNSVNNLSENLNRRGWYGTATFSDIPCYSNAQSVSWNQNVSFGPVAVSRKTYSPEAEQQFLLAQVTSTSQIRDVPNNHWAYEAIRTMVEKFGTLTTYPDGTFLGNRQVSRYEFAATLNATLDQLSVLIAGSTADLATKEDIQALRRLSTELAIEINTLERRIIYFEKPGHNEIQSN